MSWHLIALAVAALVPFFIIAAMLMHWRLESDIDASKQQLLQDAQELSQAFDQEIESSIRELTALGTAEVLHKRDFKTFQKVLARAVEHEPHWTNVIVHTSDGRAILNARLPYGTTLGQPFELKTIQRVFQSRRPVVGSIALGLSKYAFAVRVYVPDVGVSLSAVIPVETLKPFVNHGKREWARALLDSANVIAMRSRDPEKFIGKPGNPSSIKAFSQSDEGVIHMTTLDNENVYLGYSKSKLGDWHSAVSVPYSALHERAAQTWMTAVGSAVFLFLVFGAIVLLYARRIAHVIRAVAYSAHQIAAGQAPAPERTSILEVQQLQKSLRTTADLVRANDRAKSEFLANISHEIRTPLSAVLGFSELMNDEKSAGDRRKYAQIISRNGRQLSTLINDILDYAKADSGKLTVEKIPTSIRETVTDVVNVTAREARAKNLELIVEPFGEGVPATISSDPTRLYQVLSNLVLNAIKFTASGSVSIRVFSSALGEEQAVSFEVTDTGLGMSTEQQAKLFTVFTQGDATFRRRFGGSGLGLALSRHLCELMGGDLVLVSSETGRGSKFRATLPASLGALARFEEDEGGHGVISAKDTQEKALAGIRVLAADDSRDNQLLLEKYVTTQGALIDFVFNGEEAIERALKGSYDIVLMDVQMPVLDGYSATQRLRALGFKVPVIAVTAHAGREERERSLREGCDDHIVKPINRAELIATMRKHLGQ